MTAGQDACAHRSNNDVLCTRDLKRNSVGHGEVMKKVVIEFKFRAETGLNKRDDHASGHFAECDLNCTKTTTKKADRRLGHDPPGCIQKKSEENAFYLDENLKMRILDLPQLSSQSPRMTSRNNEGQQTEHAEKAVEYSAVGCRLTPPG
jgi:hypothetical protein